MSKFNLIPNKTVYKTTLKKKTMTVTNTLYLLFWLWLIHFTYCFGGNYFAVNVILPLEAILQSDFCDWLILMTYLT